MVSETYSRLYEKLSLSYTPYQLQFYKPARTSRDVMTVHQVGFLKLEHPDFGVGYGEVAPIIGLSAESKKEVSDAVDLLVKKKLTSAQLPLLPSSVFFGLESALFDLIGQHPFCWNQKTMENPQIPINGLVWMNPAPNMRSEALIKAADGFSCLKLKIGGVDFEDELAILKELRELFSLEKLTIRLDANGAFHPNEALDKLERLADYHIHSIEQPIKAGQWNWMKEITSHSPIDIALDEELIGLRNKEEKLKMLENTGAKYIILKPSLHGGVEGCDEWIHCATQHQMNWWATSALESNVGLNAIAQWLLNYPISLPQGLGTGQLYSNNIESPWVVENGFLCFDNSKKWGAIPS